MRQDFHSLVSWTEACGTTGLGTEVTQLASEEQNTAGQRWLVQWRLQLPLKDRPGEGREESPHVFLYYILNYFQVFPIGLILFSS